MVLTTWVVCLLVFRRELDGWVERNRQIDVGGWLLILEQLCELTLLHEVDLIADDTVVRQEQRPVESEVEITLGRVAQDGLQRDIDRS